MKKILIIDDNEDFLKMMELLLCGEGYDVKTLSNPNKAEEVIDEFNPELMIIDVFMPERTGFNILEDFLAKSIYQDIPKVFLTGLDDDIEKMTAKGIGVNEYITKPAVASEVLKVIEKMLDSSGQ